MNNNNPSNDKEFMQQKYNNFILFNLQTWSLNKIVFNSKLIKCDLNFYAYKANGQSGTRSTKLRKK